MKRIGKNLLVCAAVCLLTVLSAVSCFAVLMSYEINDIGLKIDIPNDYSIILRDTPADDPAFSKIGLSHDSVIAEMEKSGVYLQGYSSDNTKIIAVTMAIDESSREIVSYGQLDSTQLAAIQQGFLSSDMYKDALILDSGSLKMIYLEFESVSAGVEIYGVQGNVVENGMNYNIVLQKTGTALTTGEKDEFKSIIESIEIREPDTGAFTGNIILILLLVFLFVLIVVLFIVILKGKNKKGKEVTASSSRKLPSYIDGQEADDLMVVRARPVEKHEYVAKSIDEAISGEKPSPKGKKPEPSVKDGKEKEIYLDKFFDNTGEGSVPERKEKKKSVFQKRQEKKLAEKREKSLEAFKNAEEYNVFDDKDNQKGDEDKK